MLAQLIESVKDRFRTPKEPELLPVEPLTIELADLAKAVWLPHNTPPLPGVTIQGTAVSVDSATATAAPESPPSLNKPAALVVPAPVETAPPPPAAAPAMMSSVKQDSSTPPGVVHGGGLHSRRSLAEFVQTFITPHEEILRAQQVYEPVMAILQFLETHGECPSLVVVSPEKDQEAGDLYPVRQALLRVTLKDHTFHVTDFALKLLRDTYRDFQPLIPKVLVTALGHDLGKAPALRTATVYTMGDHTSASAVQVQKCFQGNDVPWLNEVLVAIGAHHRASNDPLDVLLKRADERARQYELAQQTGGVTVQAFEQWCQVKELLEIIGSDVNVLTRKSTWSAFAHKEVVYVVPDTLLDAASQLAKAKGVVELGLIRSQDREPMLRRLVGLLRSQQLLGEEIGEGYYGRFYQIVMLKRSNSKRMYLVPIKAEAFGATREQFQARKQGLLSLVTDVRHVR